MLVLTWVENGKEALSEVKENYSKYDLILMDVQMPVMDGIEATNKIREYEKELKTHKPILALTASVTVEEQEITKVAGMDGFALKPIILSDILEEMERIVPVGVGEENINTEMIQLEDKTTQNSLEYLKPVINVDQGLKIWIKEKSYMKALKNFTITHKNDINLIQDALKIKDYDVALRLLHTLKGLSLGFVDLQRTSQLVHDQILKNELKIDIIQLSEDFNKTIFLIETLDSEEQIDPKNILSSEALRAAIEKLIEMLEHGEAEDDLVEEVFQSLKVKYNQEDSIEFYNAVENFDYETAAQMLHTIYNNL